MEYKKGIPVSPGIAVGDAFILDSEESHIPQRTIGMDEILSEKERYQKAVNNAIEDLKKLQTSPEFNRMRDISLIFQGHILLLEDPTIKEEILRLIEEENVNVETAVSRVWRKHWKKLKGMNNSYIANRAGDLWDIERGLIKHLLGQRREDLQNLQKEVVLVAHDLTPSQTARLDTNKVLGFVTDVGGSTSHVAIMARTRGIPAVVGLGDISHEISGGDKVIIDGAKGIVIIKPEPQTLDRYIKIREESLLRNKRLLEMRSYPAESIDGYKFELMANIEDPAEIPRALYNGAMGVGLYRTEYLYIKYPSPSEQDHFEAYKEAALALKEKPLVIRTLDFGADKVFIESDRKKERNPYLGCRSIRLCFEKPDMFKTQLRAILRASVLGNIRIMFPMISSLEEIQRAKLFLSEVMEELEKEGQPFNKDIIIGTMMEVPSAVLIADHLADEVDFFSIGTNDLIQYTLAVDRINERVAHLYQPAHPSILRLISNVIQVGQQKGVDVCLCGEMSGDPNFTLLLVGMGLRKFSLSPMLIPEIKSLIRKSMMRQAKYIATKTLTMTSYQDAIDFLKNEGFPLADSSL